LRQGPLVRRQRRPPRTSPPQGVRGRRAVVLVIWLTLVALVVWAQIVRLILALVALANTRAQIADHAPACVADVSPGSAARPPASADPGLPTEEVEYSTGGLVAPGAAPVSLQHDESFVTAEQLSR